MKRRKQIGKLIYTPTWHQAEVELGEDYKGLSRDDKLEVSAQWISELLSMRNEMITNPKSWHHFMGDKSWEGLTDEEIEMIYAVTIKIRKKDIMPGEQKMFARTIEESLRRKNT